MKQLAVSSMVFVLCILGWNSTGVGEQVPIPQGELRIVDTNPANWVSLTFIVFEHLWEADPRGKLVPRLATGWRWLNDRTLEVNLRRGVTFHNGEVFNAEVVKINWDEQLKLTQPHTIGSIINFKSGSRLKIIDPYTVHFIFPEVDGVALEKISYMHMANRQFYQQAGWGTEDW